MLWVQRRPAVGPFRHPLLRREWEKAWGRAGLVADAAVVCNAAIVAGVVLSPAGSVWQNHGLRALMVVLLLVLPVVSVGLALGGLRLRLRQVEREALFVQWKMIPGMPSAVRMLLANALVHPYAACCAAAAVRTLFLLFMAGFIQSIRDGSQKDVLLALVVGPLFSLATAYVMAFPFHFLLILALGVGAMAHMRRGIDSLLIVGMLTPEALKRAGDWEEDWPGNEVDHEPEPLARGVLHEGAHLLRFGLGLSLRLLGVLFHSLWFVIATLMAIFIWLFLFFFIGQMVEAAGMPDVVGLVVGGALSSLVMGPMVFRLWRSYFEECANERAEWDRLFDEEGAERPERTEDAPVMAG